MLGIANNIGQYGYGIMIFNYIANKFDFGLFFKISQFYSPSPSGCGAAKATGLGVVCFVNPRVSSANLILGFFFVSIFQHSIFFIEVFFDSPPPPRRSPTVPRPTPKPCPSTRRMLNSEWRKLFTPPTSCWRRLMLWGGGGYFCCFFCSKVSIETGS